MKSFTETFQQHLHSLGGYLPALVYAFATFCFFILLGYLVASAVQKGLHRANFSKTYESFFLKIVRWIFGIIGFLIGLNILGFTGIAASVLAGGGVTAIVLGFAFRDIGENILAGFFLAFSRPFNIGDLIRSEDLEGRVKSVELRYTHIRTGDGCDIFIPSSQIFNRPLFNYTRDGLRRAGFVIGIDYADDAKKAASLLLESIKEVPDILKDPQPGVNISGFTPGYVELSIEFWINTFRQELILAGIKTEVMEACRKKLLQEGFTLSSNVTTALQMDKLNVHIEKQ